MMIILIIKINAMINMKVYDIPDEYVIMPNEYNFSEKIYVELWGAGGDGDNSRCGSLNGGGGGAYLKAQIYPKQQNLYIKVGKGSNTNGEFSSIMTINNDIILISDGGKSGINGGSEGIVTKAIGAIILRNISGNKGIECKYHCRDYFCTPIYDIQYGGCAGNGGSGGFGSSIYDQIIMNGKMPGGGGAPWCYNGGSMYMQYPAQCVTIYPYRNMGYGANGTVIVYF